MIELDNGISEVILRAMKQYMMGKETDTSIHPVGEVNHTKERSMD